MEKPDNYAVLKISSHPAILIAMVETLAHQPIGSIYSITEEDIPEGAIIKGIEYYSSPRMIVSFSVEKNGIWEDKREVISWEDGVSSWKL